MFTIIGGDQKEYGPVSADEIRQWIRDGRADGRTLAKLEGSGEWKPLASFEEFAGFTAATGAPPRIGVPPAAYAPNYSDDPSAQILAREPDFDIGDCISRGWTLLMNNFGVLVGGTFLIWLVTQGEAVVAVSRYFGGTFSSSLLALAEQSIPLINVFLVGALYGGLCLLFLKRIRGQSATASGAFAGFGMPFVQLLLAGFLTSLLIWVGMVCCMFPGIYLYVAWSFALPLVIDKRLEFWTAMELSRRVVTRVWFKLFVLMVGTCLRHTCFLKPILDSRLGH